MHPVLQCAGVYQIRSPPPPAHPVHQIPVRGNSLTSTCWWLFVVRLNSLVKKWPHMTVTHASTFRSSLSVFSIRSQCIWFVGRLVLRFPKALVLSSTYPCMSRLIKKHITFHFRREHSIMLPNIINNSMWTLTCFSISCSASRSMCSPADGKNWGTCLNRQRWRVEGTAEE